MLNRLMDQRMRGHPYVKSAIDIACWDHSGQSGGLPVCDSAGRTLRRRFSALSRDLAGDARSHGRQASASYRAEGYTRFQLKVGGDAETRHRTHSGPRPSNSSAGDILIADANTGWTQHEALRVADAVRNVDVYIEQPCLTYEECLAVRRHTARPFILDEVIDDIWHGRSRRSRSGYGRNQP